MTEFTVLKPEHNCWRIEHAKRVAFLIDGEAYFHALYEAIHQAKHSIFILGWDIDSRVRLVRDGAKKNVLPYQLGDCLDAAVKRRKGLTAFVLNWDWSMLYAFERELLPVYKLDWNTHKRVCFQLDNECPAEGSQHQKVVVIDDTIAFVGGIDLGKHRWDTSAHRPDDKRRTDPDGQKYPPFHDVQMLVEGDIAAAVGDLARERWYMAAGQRLDLEKKQEESKPWPAHVDADIEDVRIAISRTRPAYKVSDEVREVECLYLDMIAAAQQCIYIENQYFSSWKIAGALSKRLQEPDGPEVVLVQPFMTGGWLEQNTMDVLRSRLLKQLRETDYYNRLRVYYPGLEGLGDGEYISLHGKIMIIDDVLLRVGSSNLSNRSMGLDSECDLAIEATNTSQRSAVKTFRSRLLAEHLGVTIARVEQQLDEKKSLIAAIELLQGNSRTFKPLDGQVPELVNEVLPEAQFVDPERPLEPEQLAEMLLAFEEPHSTSRHMLSTAIILGSLMTLVGAWLWTPLGDWLDLETLNQSANWLKQSVYAPIIVVVVYLIGGLVAVPVTLLIIVTVIIFGPLLGFVYALIGAELSALLGYAVGKSLGLDVVRWISNGKINRLARILSQRDLKSIITVRIIPIASFTATNMIMGANHVRFGDLALGSLLGMIPGILAIALFADNLANLINEPSVLSFSLLALVVIMIALMAIGLKKWLSRKNDASKKSATTVSAKKNV